MKNLGLHQASNITKPFFRRFIDIFQKPKTIDDVMIYIAILYPLTVIPQIYKIFIIGDASSISQFSVLLKLFFSFPWIYYGYLHDNKPVVFSNVLWFISYVVILSQTIIYP